MLLALALAREAFERFAAVVTRVPGEESEWLFCAAKSPSPLTS